MAFAFTARAALVAKMVGIPAYAVKPGEKPAEDPLARNVTDGKLDPRITCAMAAVPGTCVGADAGLPPERRDVQETDSHPSNPSITSVCVLTHALPPPASQCLIPAGCFVRSTTAPNGSTHKTAWTSRCQLTTWGGLSRKDIIRAKRFVCHPHTRGELVALPALTFPAFLRPFVRKKGDRCCFFVDKVFWSVLVAFQYALKMLSSMIHLGLFSTHLCLMQL